MTLGGSNIWSVRLAGHLAKLGRRAILIEHTCVDWHPPLEVAIPSDVETIHCPGPTPIDATEKDIEGYASVYRNALPAIIIPNYTAAAYAACARLATERPNDVRVIGVGHGDSEDYYSLLSYYEPVIHQLIAVNRRMADHLLEIMPWRGNDIVTKSCPVDVPPALDRSYADAPTPLQLVYAGRITNHMKRVSSLIPLVKALDKLGVNFRLRVIGEGGYKRTLLDDVAGLEPDLRERISIEGQITPNQMMSVWASSDVTLLVSDSESTGLSLLEGMAAGCVPVSTRCNGPEECVQNEENGFLVHVDDMIGMAGCIQRLGLDRLMLQRMGKKAHETARDRYSYDHYVPWFLDVVEHVWDMPPRAWDPSRSLMTPVEKGDRPRSLRQKWLAWLGRMKHCRRV